MAVFDSLDHRVDLSPLARIQAKGKVRAKQRPGEGQMAE
jgi:hypothetical protein